MGLLNCGFTSPSLCCLYILSKSYEHLASAYLCILLKIHTLLNLTFFFISQCAKICYLLTFLFGWPWVIWVIFLWHFIFVPGEKRDGRDWKSLSQSKIAILFSFKGLQNIPLDVTVPTFLESLCVIFQPQWISFMSARLQKQCWSKRDLKHFKRGVSLQLPFYQWNSLPSPARCPQNLLVIVCDGQWWCWVVRGWPLAWRWPPKQHFQDCLSPFTSLSPSERPTGLLELGFPVEIGRSRHVTLSSLMGVLSSLVVKYLSQAGTFWNKTFRPPVDFWGHPHCPMSTPRRVTIGIVLKVQAD